jgi:hypothetical protein
MDAVEYIKELEQTLTEYRFKDAGALVNRIDPAAFDIKQAKTVLSLVRRKRLFAELEKVASLFYLVGNKAMVIRRQWAQALLDQNRVSQGLTVLYTMAADVADDPDERLEVNGLIGRAHKQLYVNEGDPENLVKAIQAYRPGWQARWGDYRWHGINLAALLARAGRDGIEPGVNDQVADIATDILRDIGHLAEYGVWDYGTAMEAALALGDYEEAARWMGKYVQHPAIDAFELGSTLRQLREVWKLDESDIGRKLLPVLETTKLRLEGGPLDYLPTTPVNTDGFEAVYGDEAYVYLTWIENMVERCRSVARVLNTTTGEPGGTGFLVKGVELSAAWGEGPVFVTNAHVISPNLADKPALLPGDGSVELTRLPARPRVELGPLLFTSPRLELDVSVFQLHAPVEVPALIPTPYYPLVPAKEAPPQRIYVIGHPKGGELAVSLYSNNLVAYDQERYIHYRSPTEGGHSGSPVFSRQWKLLAIHHRTREELELNEGVLFRPIKEAASS